MAGPANNLRKHLRRLLAVGEECLAGQRDDAGPEADDQERHRKR
jgi:hypothetical protein